MGVKGVGGCRVVFGEQKKRSFSSGKTHVYVLEDTAVEKKDTNSGCGVAFTPSLPRVWICLPPHPAKKNKETKHKNAAIWGAAAVPKT